MHYIDCFNIGDPAAAFLSNGLTAWGAHSRSITTQDAIDANHLRARIYNLCQGSQIPDVLIIGAHGHQSLSGFLVRNDSVRWHDLASLIAAQINFPRALIFYSCNGGYPGISHALTGQNGLELVFGPRITVAAKAMTKATLDILEWKQNGARCVDRAKTLVTRINAWGASWSRTHGKFLRVMWGQGAGTRYPDDPHNQRPIGGVIPLRGW